MSMGILASRMSMKYGGVRFIVDDKDAVGKTFPMFWEYIGETGIQLCYGMAEEVVANSLR
jgi:5-enolpyruvylshikimate-3-phosphate synthase